MRCNEISVRVYLYTRLPVMKGATKLSNYCYTMATLAGTVCSAIIYWIEPHVAR
jgi:hypothetical protein